jgi:ketosteroid isomerase-like protein
VRPDRKRRRFSQSFGARAVMAASLIISAGALRLAAQSPTDAALIRSARKAQNAAMAAGDVERAASWWTNDVVIRRGLGASVNGIEAYKAILERAPVSDTSLVYDRTTTGVTVSDHWPLAFETGTWVARRGGKGAALIVGQYSAQWVKRDGRWLIRGEVFVALRCNGIGCDSRALP